MCAELFGNIPRFLQVSAFWLSMQCALLSAPHRSPAADTVDAALPVSAENGTAAGQVDGDSRLLPPVIVTAEKQPATEPGAVIRRELIEKLPLNNRSINEALTILPGVQFSETANLSTQGGEILPPPVSISGGKTFENNFTIDGIGNNSLLDPDGLTDPVTNNNVPGHAQELFLDASLVERITVYDSNVPARYGGFKGGVVDAETISPNPWFGGLLFYRTTRDEWTSFHIDREKEENFLYSTDHREQPKFQKHHVGFDLHVPLSSRLLTVGAYRQLYSRIPLEQEGRTKTQERRAENFLFKTVFQATDRTSVDLLWTYAPYRGSYYKDGFRNSDFTLYGGGHLLAATCHTLLPLADLEMKAAYRWSENSRKAPTHMIQIQDADGNWEKEGFLGDIEKTQQSVQLKADLGFHPFAFGATSHRLNAGFDIQHIKGTTERQDTNYLYTYLFGEAPRRTVHEKADVEAILRQYGIYFEDIVTWRRLELRPGLRLDYEDFMHNLNAAPRLAASLDIFGNRGTLLVAGFNRYYAGTLLTYKLREGLKPTYQERWSAADGWTYYSSSSTNTRYSKHKTPYADEYVLGLEQQLFGGKAIAKYIRREGRDEFAKTYGDEEEDGYRYYTLNNNGRSSHESYRLSWERQWRNHYVSINGTYEETSSSNESYDKLLDEESLEKQVWYEGHLMDKSDLPREDFNRPLVLNLVYVGKFPYGFTFSGLARYRSGYRALKDSGEDMEDIVLPDGTSPPIYEEVKIGGGVILSCRIDWEKRLYRSQSMVLSLEINNLLNKKSPVADTDDFEIGRQVWAGLEYRF
jgi:hypothetical protein